MSMGTTVFEIAGGLSNPPWFNVWVPKGLVQEGLKPEKMSHRAPIIPKNAPIPKAAHTSADEAHKEERFALVLVLSSAFGIWYAFH